ncbi:hypothetical protein ABW19_dt0201996 [Dactylella cylindrospora]|nr:hypothetical protein ABW19_dt0201996 [Dactylella cylindrospora]
METEPFSDKGSDSGGPMDTNADILEEIPENGNREPNSNVQSNTNFAMEEESDRNNPTQANNDIDMIMDNSNDTAVAGSNTGINIEPTDDTKEDPNAIIDEIVPETKTGRTTRSADATAWKPYYTKSRRIVYKLEGVKQKDKDLLFHHILAPIGTLDPWYIRMKWKELFEMFEFQNFPTYTYDPPGLTKIVDDDSAVYVSLRYARFAAQGTITNTTNVFTGDINMPDGTRVSRHYEVKKSKKPTMESNEDEKGLVAVDEIPEGFEWSNAHRDRLSRHGARIGRLKGVPFRTADGSLYWGALDAGLQQQKYHRDVWYRYFLLDQRHKTGGDGKGWRVRYDDRDLKFPLVVEMLGNTKDRFAGTRYKTGEQLIGNLIDAINHMYTKPKKTVRSNQLELFDPRKHNNLHTDYHLLSKNPFGMFQTYIHKTEVNGYMTELKSDLKVIVEAGAETTPLRRLPAAGAFEGSMEKYLEKIEKGDNASDVDEDEDEEVMTGAEMEEVLAQVKVDASKEETNWDEEETNEATNNNNNQVLTQHQAPPQTTKKGQTPQQKSEQFKAKIKAHYDKEAHPTGWRLLSKEHDEIVLSSKKILNAKGTRKGQKSQKDVMGFSASQLAERVLKWTAPDPVKTKCKKRQMKNGLYIAEWLHLCAYSWGGLLNTTNDEKNLESSQTVGNLVLGTSEANSCMTRYESSWQALFLDEAHFAEKIKGNGQTVNITGFLEVQRNPEGYERGHDEHAPGETPEYVWQSVNLFQDDHALANYAAKAKLLAYTVFYQPSITAPEGSEYSSLILRRKSPTARDSAVFYPFSRRFFHRSEYLLDSALYQAMYILTANEKLKEEDAIDMIKKRFRYTNEYISGVLKSGEFDPEAVDANRKQKQKKNHQKAARATTQKMLYMFTDRNKSDPIGRSTNRPTQKNSGKGGRGRKGEQDNALTGGSNGFSGMDPQFPGGNGFNNLNSGNGSFNFMSPQSNGTGNDYSPYPPGYFQNMQNGYPFAQNNQPDTQNNFPGSQYIPSGGYSMQNGNQFQFNQGNQSMQNSNNVFNQNPDNFNFNFNQQNNNSLFQNNSTKHVQDFQTNAPVNPFPPTNFNNLNNPNSNMNMQTGNPSTATLYPSMADVNPDDYARLLGTIDQTDGADTQIQRGRRRDGRPGNGRQQNSDQNNDDRNRYYSLGGIERLKKKEKLETQDEQP